MTMMAMSALLYASVAAAPAQDFEAAHRESLVKGQPLVVTIGATWCPACVELEKHVLPKLAKTGHLNDVVYYHVDVDRERRLAGRLLKGNSIPQMVRLEKTPKGHRVTRLVGLPAIKKIKAFLKGTPAE